MISSCYHILEHPFHRTSFSLQINQPFQITCIFIFMLWEDTTEGQRYLLHGPFIKIPTLAFSWKHICGSGKAVDCCIYFALQRICSWSLLRWDWFPVSDHSGVYQEIGGIEIYMSLTVNPKAFRSLATEFKKDMARELEVAVYQVKQKPCQWSEKIVKWLFSAVKKSLILVDSFKILLFRRKS